MANAQSSGPLSSFAPTMKGIFRIGVALLFMQHGAQKLFGLFGGMDGEGATAELLSLMGVAGVLEFFGGFLVVVGLYSRAVSGILALQMVIAYFMAHASNAVFPIQDGGGELALLYALAFALIAVIGAGKFNLDSQLST